MAYRNGTYVAFHAAGKSDPTASDMKYYRLLEAWKVRDQTDFNFINSHEKVAAVRDSSSRQRLEAVLAERLRNSKNMILILGETTKRDRDWIPFEISYAVDKCKIPIIAAYLDREYILDPRGLSSIWPATLTTRIDDNTARVIHVPFKQRPLADAVSQFTLTNLPKSGLRHYNKKAYETFGIRIG